VLKKPETYEIMKAEDVGWSDNRMVLGKHSGRNAFKSRMTELGHEFRSEEDLNKTFYRFKELADKKHEIFDEDLQALISEASSFADEETIKLIALKVCSETGEIPCSTVTLRINEQELTGSAKGSGAVDASLKAIESLVKSNAVLELYSVNSLTNGTDAQGEVTVRLDNNGRIVNGQGADTDIVIASAKAYINALSKLQSPELRKHPQKGNV
jgi:2-isopropylmalate synthase